MVDVSAGVLADAHRVRNLYRRAFATDAKSVARGRVIAAFVAAGTEVVIDLWGGGASCDELVAAGFRVIAVENGAMRLLEGDSPVSAERKKRALRIAGMEGGYETFWGSVEDAVAAHPEATGIYLDFCGPWTAVTREAVKACRHMECVAVTLVPDHDMSTDASSAFERELAYQLYLRLAWAQKPRWASMNSADCRVRRLLDYRRSSGVSVFVYLLSHRWLSIPALLAKDRLKTRPDMRDRVNATGREWYRKQPGERRKTLNNRSRHNDHLRRGKSPRMPCPVCGLVRLVLCRRCASRVRPGANTQYCSDLCIRQAKLDYQRNRRMLAAVSGTAAEAISTEEAA